MDRTLYRALTWSLWLTLPFTAIRYWQVWDRLPAYVATHFNAANQPNGWMTLETSLWFALGLTAFLVSIFSAVLFVINRKRNELGVFAWALLGFFYLIIGIVYSVNSGILDFALYAKPINFGAILVTVPLAVIVLIALFLVGERGAALPVTDVIAIEVHATGSAGAFLLLAVAIELAVLLLVPIPAVRFGIVLVGLILAVACAVAWRGFQYCFTRQGVEIRALGFRLRSIPLKQITEYAIRPWSPMGGYGIRGVGSRRAYVWGSKGVLVKTRDGEVFLGHREPERIVHDLDTMMRSVAQP